MEVDGQRIDSMQYDEWARDAGKWEQDLGRRLSPDAALKHAAVYHCCRIICGALAQVHWRVVSDGETTDEMSRLERLLNTAVHPRWTAASFREWVGQSLLLRGNAYALIHRDDANEVTRLSPLPHDKVEPKAADAPDAPLRYVVDSHGRPAEDILDVPNFGWNGVRAPSVLTAGARGAVAISADLERYTGTFFRKGSLHRFIVQVTRPMAGREWRRFKRRWARGSRGVSGSSEPLFVPPGMQVTPVSLTNTDAELLANRDYQVTDILRAFGVPSALGNQEAKNTSFGSGLAALLHGFARYTLAPHVARIEAELNAKLAPTSGEWRISLDMSDLLRATFREQIDAMRQALGGSSGSGILTPNEARRFLGYAPLDFADADRVAIFRTRASKE